VRLQRGLIRHLPGIPRKPTRKRQPSPANPLPSAYSASTLSMAAANLTNMVVVSAVSGAVLLGLLAAMHF
jgi:hypothetical protein